MNSSDSENEDLQQGGVNGNAALAIEAELGGVEVYRMALDCAVNEDLKKEWEEYLEQTQNHVVILEKLFAELGLDSTLETPGRAVVRHIGQSLVRAMEMAKASGNPNAAQLVAAECVVHAETKDHLDWELIGECAKKAKGDTKKALTKAHGEVEDEEDEHLYHTTGWAAAATPAAAAGRSTAATVT